MIRFLKYLQLPKILTLLSLSTAIASDEKHFERRKLSAASLNIQSNIREVRSKIDCARECTNLQECVGFLYDGTQKSCRLYSGCINLGLLNSTEGEDVYVVSANDLLARGKPATLSSVRSMSNGLTFGGDKAVDGYYRPLSGNELFSLVETQSQNEPWLRVDLQNIHCIWAVRILNRGDHATSVWQRARNVIITASQYQGEIFYDVNPASLCAYHEGIINQYYTTLTCEQPMRAQFVQIQLDVSNVQLNIYEFEVHGL